MTTGTESPRTLPSMALATPLPASDSRCRAWGLTGLLLVLYAINLSDKAIFGIIAQPLAEELGLSSSQLGLAASLFYLTFTIGCLGAGLLNRWLSLRWSLTILALCWAASLLPVVVVATFGVFVAGRLILGLSEGPSSALIHTATYSWHPREKRGLPSALLASAASVAKIAGAPILAYVAVTHGWRASLIALTVAGMLWCVVWLAVWSDGPYAAGRAKDAPVKGALPAQGEEPRVPWMRIFTTRTFVAGVLLTMSVYGLITTVLTWLPSYFEKGLGYSRLQAGAMFALPSIFSLVCMLSTSVIGDYLITKGATSRAVRILLPGSGVVLCGIILFALPYISHPAVAVVVVSAGYAFAVSVSPLYNAVLSEICPPAQIAGTLGVFMAITAIGGLIAPYATGMIVDAAATPVAGYSLAFQLQGGVAAFFAILVLVLANPARDKAIIRGAAPTP